MSRKIFILLISIQLLILSACTNYNNKKSSSVKIDDLNITRVVVGVHKSTAHYNFSHYYSVICDLRTGAYELGNTNELDNNEYYLKGSFPKHPDLTYYIYNSQARVPTQVITQHQFIIGGQNQTPDTNDFEKYYGKQVDLKIDLYKGGEKLDSKVYTLVFGANYEFDQKAKFKSFYP